MTLETDTRWISPRAQREVPYTNGNYFSLVALPFHGFLQLLFYVARLKFSSCSSLLESLQKLLAFCDASLRHYGVRSTRLRRAEIENDENAKYFAWCFVRHAFSMVEIYLLPNRIRRAYKPFEMPSRANFKSPTYIRRSALHKTSRSMPRLHKPTPLKIFNVADGMPSNGSLPKINVQN